MLKQFFKNQKPTTIIILMFSLCLTTQIIQLMWDVFKPKVEKTSVAKPIAEKDDINIQKESSKDGLSIEEKDIEERAKISKALLDSKRPLTRADSLYIIQTHDMIKSLNNHKILYK